MDKISAMMSQLKPKFIQENTTPTQSKKSKDSEKVTGERISEVKTNMMYHLHAIVIEDPANNKTAFKVNDQNKQILTDLKNYLARTPGNLDYSKGIMFTGSVGTGKTMILEMLKRCILDLWGKQLSIHTAPYIKQQFYADPTDGYSMAYMVQNYRYLGINDIGLEQTTMKGDEIIRNIIYERFEKRLFTFGTMNLELPEFFKRYEYADDVGRMADRFKHLFNYVKLDGNSFR